MGTRSNIGIVNEDKSITSIYCHWDGYPEYVGKLLLNHYNNAGIINELMDLGDLSQLGEKLYCDNNSHTFDKPETGVCVAYGRDRGEEGTESRLFKSLSQFERHMNDSTADYQYLFENNKWKFRGYKTDWKDLTPADCKM